MDFKAKIEKAVKELLNDDKLMEKFEKNPVEIVEKLVGADLPDELVNQAVDAIKARGGRKIKFLCIIAAPEGVSTLMQAHPDIQLYVGCLDRCLNGNAYICPGLGDAGDRIFGTA